MIRLFGRRKPAAPALLSDAEMAKLNEEIFEEPVSIERIFTIFYAMPAADRERAEWVMDSHTLNRVRIATLPTGPYFHNAATTAGLVKAAISERLLGVPIVIEPFAKLALRVRAS